MADVFSSKKRSEIMSSVASYNTSPEMIVRRFLRKHKVTFSMHSKNIIGKPDFAFRKERIVVFIDGCFWHGCTKHRTIPKTNRTFWKNKIDYNKKRRLLVKRELRKTGWKVLEFWEHDVNKYPDKVVTKILKALDERN